MTNLDSILKNRDITLPTKVHLVKTMVFPVVMYGCEIWTIKKVECQRIDAFELCCCSRLLRVCWTARSNQSVLKEINREYPLRWLTLKLKLWYFDHLMGRVDLLDKTLDAGKDWGQGEKEATEDEMVGWHHWLNGHESEQTSGDSEEQVSLMCWRPWGPKQLDSTEWLNNNKWYTYGSY